MDAHQAGDRVETLLADLRIRTDPQVAGLAEELVSCLVQLYGAGLAAIMAAIGEDTRLQALLIGDPLVEGLLLVHDLHPLDTEARIKRALGRLGPGTEFLGVDGEGKVHVKLASGCGSTVAAVQQAVANAAPETTGVELAPRDPPLLQITRRPAEAR
ncbi:MAG: hypothetical protein ABSA93_12390 [Streptosporangiaceae bacterium]|jgi:hypothetical protein